MSGIVPFRPPPIVDDVVRVGEAVRGPTAVDAAAACNHVLGRGEQIVPAYAVTSATLTKNSAYKIKWRILPRYQVWQRYLWLACRSSASTSSITVEFPTGATAVTRSVTGSRSLVAPRPFEQTLSSQAATETELDITITSNNDDLQIDGISVEDVPRAVLDTAGDDLGTDTSRLIAGQPILYSTVANLFTAAYDDSLIGKRTLWQWAVPYSAGGATTTSFALSSTDASFTNKLAAGAPVLARQLDASATTATVKAAFLCWASDGTTAGQIRINSSVNGAGTTGTISAGTTSPTWVTATNNTIDATDLGTSDGLQSSTFDLLQLQMQRTAGAGTLYCATVSVFEV